VDGHWTDIETGFISSRPKITLRQAIRWAMAHCTGTHSKTITIYYRRRHKHAEALRPYCTSVPCDRADVKELPVRGDENTA